MNKKIVHTVFEATAEKFPDRIAVETGSRSISYSALKKHRIALPAGYVPPAFKKR